VLTIYAGPFTLDGVPVPRERSEDWPQVARALGVRVSLLRLSRKLTQEQLAHAAGLSRSYVQKIEHATVCPTLDVLLRLARALDVTVIQLLPAGMAGLTAPGSPAGPAATDGAARSS
jgi:DNA-binding XRE family transcriptional regulator